MADPWRMTQDAAPDPLFLVYHLNSQLDRGAAPLIDPKSRRVHAALEHSRARPRGLVLAPSEGPQGAQWQALQRVARTRRSALSFGAGTVDAGQLLAVLRFAYGLEGDRCVTPSAGRLYPLTLWAVLARTTAPTGLYEFDAARYELVRIDRAPDLSTATADPVLVQQAAVVLMVLGFPARTWWKYRERAYRLMLLEAGHLMQNALLASACLGIAACPFMGFHELEAERRLGLDGASELLLYSALLGPPP
jgi:SagB-type dehydrogenase family enzyme